MTEGLPILYVKSGCPWCDEAVDYLSSHNLEYEERNVTVDRTAFAEMQRKSGQTKAPVLDWHGHILADFGTDELEPFLREHHAVPQG